MKRVVKSVDEAAPGGPVPGQVPHVRIRCKEEFSADELAQLQAKLEGWMRTVGTRAEGKRQRHQFVMKTKNQGTRNL
jgi:hypothetical protein